MGRPIQIDIDCRDPERLAAFWAEVLQYRVADPPSPHSSWAEASAAEASEPGEAWCAAFDPDGRGPRFLFHRVPEPKTVKNRLHLDVWVTERGAPDDPWPAMDAEVTRLASLGAVELRRSPADERYVVMADPEGNEFCVCG